MYLALETIQEALEHLENIHPFYGVTFLVCKQNKIPVGEAVEFRINAKEKEFLDHYYKPADFSRHYYRVFRPSDKKKEWVDAKKYASSTIQAIRTQTFKDVLLHPTPTQWGWAPDYIAKLNLTYIAIKISAFLHSIWQSGCIESEIGPLLPPRKPL